jgi:hypothetical protein
MVIRLSVMGRLLLWGALLVFMQAVVSAAVYLLGRTLDKV